ncbi:MAG: hypothetical protein RhofKO_35870 [Rhodothermales bacterium]
MNTLTPIRPLFNRPLPMSPASLTEPAHPLVEPSLFYDPPYERPLEDEFAWHLVKYLDPVAGLLYQERVETKAGAFWINFVVETGLRRIGFEVGELDADADTQHDHLRDALLVGSDGLDVVYRLRGRDLLYRLHDCLYLVAQWEPKLFSQRGHINLRTLAAPDARAQQPRRSDAILRLSYDAPQADGAPDLILHRTDKQNPASWVRAYDQALVHFGVQPDALSRSA